MNATNMTTTKQPALWKRVLMFVFVGIPGAVLLTYAGMGVGVVMADAKGDFMVMTLAPLVAFAAGVAAGSVLLLAGTRTLHQPLILLVVLPPPILLSLGYCLHEVGDPWALPFRWLGVLTPVLYFPVSRHYQPRAAKRTAHDLAQTPNPQPSTAP